MWYLIDGSNLPSAPIAGGDNVPIAGAVALMAAQASLNMAYTRATFQILGYNSPDLVKSLPSFEEMTVSN